MLNVALTGNVAAGKSSVAELFSAWGATVIDADAIVRGLQQPGTPVFRAIVARFGPGAVAADGTLDRAALRARIVASVEDRKALEAIVHPAVESERRGRLARAASSGVPIVISDIPLLFEAMDPARFEAVILVDAPEPVRQARIVATRGVSPEEADALIRAQLPAAAKRARADYIIENDASRDILRDHAWLVWRRLVSRTRAQARARA